MKYLLYSFILIQSIYSFSQDTLLHQKEILTGFNKYKRIVSVSPLHLLDGKIHVEYCDYFKGKRYGFGLLFDYNFSGTSFDNKIYDRDVNLYSNDSVRTNGIGCAFLYDFARDKAGQLNFYVGVSQSFKEAKIYTREGVWSDSTYQGFDVLIADEKNIEPVYWRSETKLKLGVRTCLSRIVFGIEWGISLNARFSENDDYDLIAGTGGEGNSDIPLWPVIGDVNNKFYGMIDPVVVLIGFAF